MRQQIPKIKQAENTTHCSNQRQVQVQLIAHCNHTNHGQKPLNLVEKEKQQNLKKPPKEIPQIQDVYQKRTQPKESDQNAGLMRKTIENSYVTQPQPIASLLVIRLFPKF